MPTWATNLSALNDQIASIFSAIVSETGDQLVGAWTREAQLALKSSTSYIHHISTKEISPTHVRVSNDHPAALFLELGVDPFDMKKSLATSPKVRIGKKGQRYLIIPFDHPLQRIVAEGHVAPEELSELAPSKWLTRGQNVSAHQYEWGDALTDMGNVGKKRKYWSAYTGPMARFDKRGFDTGAHGTIDYTWKTSPFERIYRFVDSHGKTTSFTAFRTISSKSEPDAWIHPGIRAMRIAGTAVEQVRPQFNARVSDAIKRTLRDALGAK